MNAEGIIPSIYGIASQRVVEIRVPGRFRASRRTGEDLATAAGTLEQPFRPHIMVHPNGLVNPPGAGKMLALAHVEAHGNSELVEVVLAVRPLSFPLSRR